jgi:hypothetical protein
MLSNLYYYIFDAFFLYKNYCLDFGPGTAVQSIFLQAYLSSFQVLVNRCCVQKQEEDVSKSLSIAASLLRNEKRDDEDCMYMTYPFGLDVNSFQIMQIDRLKRTDTT